MLLQCKGHKTQEYSEWKQLINVLRKRVEYADLYLKRGIGIEHH